MTNLVDGRRIEIVRGQAGGELADQYLSTEFRRCGDPPF
jgi:hypothetical protein